MIKGVLFTIIYFALMVVLGYYYMRSEFISRCGRDGGQVVHDESRISCRHQEHIAERMK